MKKEIEAIEKEFKFQRAEWPVYRIGWILMGIFLLAGLLGAFGTGAFSRQTQHLETMDMEYDRILRYSVQASIVIKLKKPLTDSTLSLNKEYAEKIKIDKIIPEPASMELRNNKLLYRFSSSQIQEITLFIEPTAIGNIQLNFESGAGKNTIQQFIFF